MPPVLTARVAMIPCLKTLIIEALSANLAATTSGSVLLWRWLSGFDGSTPLFPFNPDNSLFIIDRVSEDGETSNSEVALGDRPYSIAPRSFKHSFDNML